MCGLKNNNKAWIPWTARKANKWVLDHIKSELSLEIKMTKMGLWYFAHHTKTRLAAKERKSEQWQENMK